MSGTLQVMANTEIAVTRDRSLAPLTTLELGGPAEYFIDITEPGELGEAITWAADSGVKVTILGGGSNVVVADEGVKGLVVRLSNRGIEVERSGEHMDLRVAAGEPWDGVVEQCVAEGWGGLECLSGIPGYAGATPIQNVGAYGQEVAQTLVGVRALNLSTQEITEFSRDECGFGYRTSVFRTDPGRFALISLHFRLLIGGTPAVRYSELQKLLGRRTARPTLLEVREAVLELRRSKSMVIETGDPNRRSVGSFFVNPVLIASDLNALVERAVNAGALKEPDQIPRHEFDDGRFKVPAAWLIERAGFGRGFQRGAVGISSRHALALVHHGSGTCSELIELATEIQDRVRALFGVELRPEPVFLGFGSPTPMRT